MKKTNLDLNWKFSLDSEPETLVNLPHDFSIIRPRTPDSLMRGHGGFFQGGNGLYKKTLELDKSFQVGSVVLEVEGAYMNTEVFINGNLAVFNPYGYTTFHANLTPWLEYNGADKLEIRVQNNALPNSRWYSGSGLYRHVWLLTGIKDYIKPWGIFVTTPVVNGKRSVVRVETEFCGGALLRHTLLDASGTVVAKSEAAAADGRNMQKLTIENPKLWDTVSPTLYTLRSELIAGGGVADTVETTVGIRSIALDHDKGFLLNGKALKLKGGCVHHDCGILGAASWDTAEERKVLAHKEAGFNAIRCAHNPPSPAFLDACDRHGIVVMDEAFDCWRMGKTPYDYHLYFESYWRKDISSMVLRDRNHPSIAFWSTGNEITERRGTSDGYRWSAELAGAIRQLDDTRFVSNALCLLGEKDEWGGLTEQYVAPLDVVGYNYLWKRYDDDLIRFPNRFIYSTETVANDAFENWAMVEKYPRIIGDCVWTSLDYIGEAGIGHSFLPGEDNRTHGLGFPWHLANCGDLDICCRPRPQSYYRQILWGHRTAPYIAVHRPNGKGLKPEFNYWGWSDVQNSWSWPGCEGYKAYIDVYSHCDEVELFVNGKSLGRKPAGKTERNIASFEAMYEPGSMKAIAYINGKAVDEDAVITCGAPSAIHLEADRSEISAAWGGLAYVTATVLDENGNPVPWARNEMYFAVSGAGALAAVGTNDPLSKEPFVGNHRSAFEGTVLAAVRSDGESGEIVLTVSAEGLNATQIVLTAK